MGRWWCSSQVEGSVRAAGIRAIWMKSIVVYRWLWALLQRVSKVEGSLFCPQQHSGGGRWGWEWARTVQRERERERERKGQHSSTNLKKACPCLISTKSNFLFLFRFMLFCFVLFFFFFFLAWNFSKSVYFIYFYFFTVFCRFWSEQPSQWPWVWLWKLVPVCFRSCWFHFFPHNYFFLFCRFPFQFCFVPVTFYFCWILCIPAVSAHLIPFLCHLFVWTALPVLQYQIPGLLHNMGSSSSVRIEPPAAVWDTVCPSVSLWG